MRKERGTRERSWSRVDSYEVATETADQESDLKKSIIYARVTIHLHRSQSVTSPLLDQAGHVSELRHWQSHRAVCIAGSATVTVVLHCSCVA